MLLPVRFPAWRLGLSLSNGGHALRTDWRGRDVEISEQDDSGRAATVFTTRLAAPRKLGLSLQRRVDRFVMRANDVEAAQALLDGGLEAEVANAGADLVDVDDQSVRVGTWGSVLRPSTLRTVLDAAARIATRIDEVPLEAATVEPIAIVIHAPPLEIALTVRAQASRADGYIHYERDPSGPRIAPPGGAMAVATGDARFDAEWLTLVSGPRGVEVSALRWAMRPWILEVIAGRSPRSVSFHCQGEGLEIRVRLEKADNLAREVAAWTEIARRFSRERA